MTALELLKSRDSMQALILFIRSEEAQRIMAAWPLLGTRNVDRQLKKNEKLLEATADLWKEANKSFSMADLADQADVPFTRCDKIFFRLIRAGIVYPDGTISPNASNLLVTSSIAHLRSLNPRGKAHEGSRINPAGESVPKPNDVGLPTGQTAERGADKVRRAPARKPGAKAR